MKEMRSWYLTRVTGTQQEPLTTNTGTTVLSRTDGTSLTPSPNLIDVTMLYSIIQCCTIFNSVLLFMCLVCILQRPRNTTPRQVRTFRNKLINSRHQLPGRWTCPVSFRPRKPRILADSRTASSQPRVMSLPHAICFLSSESHFLPRLTPQATIFP